MIPTSKMLFELFNEKYLSLSHNVFLMSSRESFNKLNLVLVLNPLLYRFIRTNYNNNTGQIKVNTNTIFFKPIPCLILLKRSETNQFIKTFFEEDLFNIRKS